MKYSIQLADPIEFLKKGLSRKAIADQLEEFMAGNIDIDSSYTDFFSQLDIAVEQGLATIKSEKD